MTERAEHLAWCKQRALAYVDAGNLADAVTSMVSDLGKHPDTEPSQNLIVLVMSDVVRGDAAGVRRWIEGFR